MKQIFLFIFLFLASLNVIKAQDLSITPNNVTLDTILDIETNAFPQWLFAKTHSNIYNNTSDNINLRWDIFQIEGPPEWEAQLCVNDTSGSCYAWGVSTNFDPMTDSIPLLIFANNKSLFDLGVRPNLVGGCGTFEVRVSPYDDSTNVQIVGTYHFRLNADADCNSTVATENFDKSTAKIFPNPTADFFTITDNPYVKSIEIFDMVGKQMAVAPFQNGNTINVSNFPNGLYLVRMLDDDGDVLKTTRLTKR